MKRFHKALTFFLITCIYCCDYTPGTIPIDKIKKLFKAEEIDVGIGIIKKADHNGKKYLKIFVHNSPVLADTNQNNKQLISAVAAYALYNELSEDQKNEYDEIIIVIENALKETVNYTYDISDLQTIKKAINSSLNFIKAFQNEESGTSAMKYINKDYINVTDSLIIEQVKKIVEGTNRIELLGFTVNKDYKVIYFQIGNNENEKAVSISFLKSDTDRIIGIEEL